MKRINSWRSLLAVTLLAAVAVTNVRLVRAVWADVNPAWNADAAVHRFAPLVRELPAGTEVNYVDAQPSAGGEDFLLARYALVPLRVVVSGPRGWVVVDSADPVLGLDDEPAGVRKVADYGDGLRLFAREVPE